MPISRPLKADPEAASVTDEELRAWWEAEFGMVAELGCDHEKAAEAMFTVAARHLGEALGPRRLAVIAQLLAHKLLADAERIDAAIAAATAGVAGHA